MRVFKTEAYFDGVEAPDGLSLPSRPGIGVAWIDATGIGLDPSDLSGLDFLGEDPFPLARLFLGDIYLEGVPAVFAGLVNAAVRDLPFDLAATHSSADADIVEAVRAMPIEIAPQKSVPLIDLLAGGAGRVAGIILGWRPSGRDRWLALITRPDGLLLIGSAIAVTSALEQGLERSLERLFEDKRQAPRRR